jgi:eukaryotic-like serine/threonine-protein kinase
MTIKRIGKYTILGQLGAGAHSTILHISRAEDGRQYALKVVPVADPEEKKFLEQAEHEFRISQMLDHANLIKVHHLENQTDWLFRPKKALLLIEYVANGQTLDHMKSLSLEKLVPLFVQVASALVHMHRRGVLHADMKPSNIVVNQKTNQAKVIDYGLAWVKGESKGRVQGTPEYIAPETVTGGIVSEKTDIFNFGATMYRMLTWRFPPSLIPEPGTVRMNAKVYAQMLKPVSECNSRAPAVLCQLVRRCLEYNADQRPERMSEVQGTLDKIADELGPPDDADWIVEPD